MDEVQERKVVTMMKYEYSDEAMVFSVKELKELLGKFDDDDLVRLEGGESGEGDYVYIGISDSKEGF